MKKLLDLYDDELTISMSECGLKRVALGFYVAPVDGLIWKGLAVPPITRHGQLWLSPGLGIYCPDVYKIMKSIFRAMGNQGFETGALSQRMGVPLIIEPLNKLVSQNSAIQRSSTSYNIADERQIRQSVDLICQDFMLTRDIFLGSLHNISDLVDYIQSAPLGRYPNAAISLMSLTLSIDRKSKVDSKLSLQKLENIRSLYKSVLADEFYEYAIKLC